MLLKNLYISKSKHRLLLLVIGSRWSLCCSTEFCRLSNGRIPSCGVFVCVSVFNYVVPCVLFVFICLVVTRQFMYRRSYCEYRLAWGSGRGDGSSNILPSSLMSPKDAVEDLRAGPSIRPSLRPRGRVNSLHS